MVVLNLFEVMVIYSKDPKNIVVCTPTHGYVAAGDVEQAKVKSGVYAAIHPSWDTDYVQILVRQVGAVKVPPEKT